MAQFEFGQNEPDVREFFPTYAGIEWHDAYISRHGTDNNSAWGEAFDNIGEFCEQLHQENCCIYLNDTDPFYDVIVVIDHRDDSGDWWFSREQIGSDEFDLIINNLGPEVMMISTKYPLRSVAEYVTDLLTTDIRKLLE